jgi:hypothetical protein
MGFCNLRIRPFQAGILVFFAALSACDLEMPQRVLVNTTLDLHVPIGDIGDVQEVRESLEYTNAEKIAEIFGDTDVNVYYFYTEKGYTDGDKTSGYVIPLPKKNFPNENAEAPYDDASTAICSNEVRTLFMHFPLASVNLDFTEYLKTEIETPDVVAPDTTKFPDMDPGSDIPGGYPLEMAPIPLGAMSEWIEYIKLNGDKDMTTVTLEGGAELADTLKLAIPGLGIGKDKKDFQPGKPEGKDLVFSADRETTLKPQEDKEIKVFSQWVKVPKENGGGYKIEIDLKWTEAEVHTGENGNYGGVVNIPLEQFSDILEKYKLVTFPCYLYVGGPFGGNAIQGATITLDGGDGWKIEKSIDQSYAFAALYTGLSPGKSYGEPLSYASTISFNLAEKVNVAQGNIQIAYTMELGSSYTVTPDTAKDSAITADLVALLPMQMEVLEVNPETTPDYGSDGAYDLFGRDQAGVSLNRITSARVSGRDMVNTLYAGDLFFRMYDDVSLDKLVKITPGEDCFMDIAGDPYIPMPFHPVFAVYMKKPAEGPPFVKIKPKKDGVEDSFSIILSANVTGEAEYEQDL